jgi:lysozyme
MPKPSEMTLSSPGFDCLHMREGLRLEAYLDSTGVLTIGLGHTSAAGPPEVVQGMVITENQAEFIFRSDSETFRDEVIKYVKVNLEQHEFDACCSFLYNVGSTNFLGSTFLERLNSGDKPGAAEAMLWWNQPPEIITRRQGEYQQFKNGLYIPRADAQGNPV